MSQHTYMNPYENEYLTLNQNTYDHNQQFLTKYLTTEVLISY